MNVAHVNARVSKVDPGLYALVTFEAEPETAYLRLWQGGVKGETACWYIQTENGWEYIGVVTSNILDAIFEAVVIASDEGPSSTETLQ